jgi:hypothetical protein
MPIDRSTLLRHSRALLLLCPLLAWADGASELSEALARYAASTPFKAQVEAKTFKRDGEGKDAEDRSGQASVVLEENAAGLRLQFARDTLNRLGADELAREKDAKAKTPILSALNALNTTELRQMANAAPVLRRLLEKANFKTERAELWNGKPARLLNFELGQETLSEKDRKYVKKFEGILNVWIAADGTPLASREHQSASGRAFLVISFEMVNDEDVVYQLLGDRLLTARKESHNVGSGAGERGESRTLRTLQLLP